MPTTPEILWDLVRPADLRNSITQGFQLTRGLLVRNIPIDIDTTYGTDPKVLLKCLAVTGFPKVGSKFLDDPTYDWLYVEEQRVREIVSKTAIKFDILYHGIPPPNSGDPVATWVVQEDFVLSVIPTMTTAFGGDSLTCWYKSGSSSATTKPAGANEKATRGRKYVAHRHVKVIGTMPKTIWDTIKTQYRNLAGSINDDTWSGGTRGTWLFCGPRTVTKNVGAMVTVELPFMYEPRGWYSVAAWFNSQGEHPTDSVTEGGLRTRGLPALDAVLRGNGLSIASVQSETDFGFVFDFTIT